MFIIFFHVKARQDVSKMTLQKLTTDLGYKTLPYPPYLPDLSSTDKHFFKDLDIFYGRKTFNSKGEVENALKDFEAS